MHTKNMVKAIAIDVNHCLMLHSKQTTRHRFSASVFIIASLHLRVSISILPVVEIQSIFPRRPLEIVNTCEREKKKRAKPMNWICSLAGVWLWKRHFRMCLLFIAKCNIYSVHIEKHRPAGQPFQIVYSKWLRWSVCSSVHFLCAQMKSDRQRESIMQ